jgi:hypothetical protein
MTVEQIRAELDERLPDARQEAHESLKADPNSYWAGYDTGYWKALEEILKFVNGETES